MHAEIGAGISLIYRAAGLQTPVDRSDSIKTELELLLSALLEHFPKHSRLVEILLKSIDKTLLPLLQKYDHPLASAFSSSDELLILPLLRFHPDTEQLLRHTESLRVSPLASVLYFSADALHLKYFPNYDSEDLFKIPGLLNTILPEVLRLTAEIPLSRQTGSTGVSENKRRAGSQQSIQSVAEKNLTIYVRGLLNGLVMMADTGAFSRVVPELRLPSAKQTAFLEDFSANQFGERRKDFHPEMLLQGRKYFNALREAASLLPHEFSLHMPKVCSYVHGHYGSDELASVLAFNEKKPKMERITLAKVLTGSSAESVQDYYAEHNGQIPVSQSHVAPIIPPKSPEERAEQAHHAQLVWEHFRARLPKK